MTFKCLTPIIILLQVDRYTKTKKSTYTSFELFRFVLTEMSGVGNLAHLIRLPPQAEGAGHTNGSHGNAEQI